MDSADGHIQAMISLVREKDPTWQHVVAVSHFEETGRGMKAIANIAAGSTIIRIPQQVLITKSTILSLFRSYSDAFPPNIDEHAVLALFVYLICDIPHSLHTLLCSYLPYAATLPSNYPTLYFNSHILNHPFVPSHVKVALHNQRKSLKNHYNLVHDVVSKISPHHKLSRTRFDKAWFTVNTRCVSLPQGMRDTMALAPLLDMLNHHNSTDITMTLQEGYYSLITHSSWIKDSQVFINYGPHSNWMLWLEYGFVLPGNTQVIPLVDTLFRMFPNSLPSYQEKWDILQDLGLVSPDVLCFPATYGFKCAVYLLLSETSHSLLANNNGTIRNTFQSLYFSGDIDTLVGPCSTVHTWLQRLRQTMRSEILTWLETMVHNDSPLKIIMQDSLIILDKYDE